jgi:hypothetical protein
MLFSQERIKKETFNELFAKANNYLVVKGYEIFFRDNHRILENLISIFNESLEKGDIKHLRSIQFEFFILLDKGVIKELNHNLFANFLLVYYYDNDSLMYRFSSPRLADLFNSRRMHKLNVFVTFTRKIKTSFIEQFLKEKNIEYSRPVKSRINIEVELKEVEVIKYLI